MLLCIKRRQRDFYSKNRSKRFILPFQRAAYVPFNIDPTIAAAADLEALNVLRERFRRYYFCTKLDRKIALCIALFSLR